MTEDLKNHARVMRAIGTSCIPLLYGDDGVTIPLSRRLFRRYGIVSYTVRPHTARRAGILTRLLARPCRKELPEASSELSLSVDAAIRFLGSFGTDSVLPVFVDCTEGASVLSCAPLREMLEAHAFTCVPETLRETPPFSYLQNREVHP